MANIPEHAKCVFKGITFDVYQWEQELKDGSTQTFECLKRLPSVNVLATHNGNMIYLDEIHPNNPPFSGIVSGSADHADEDPLDTAKRELLEETGMVSEDWELLLHNNQSPRLDWDIYTYIARDCKKVSEQNLDLSEEIIVKETSIEDFFENIITDDIFRAYEVKQKLFKSLDSDELEKLKSILMWSEN